MHPARRNKIDSSKLSPQEQLFVAKYGNAPRKSVLTITQRERKYFDSGDYALSKAGVTPQSMVGTAIPNPENIPHASPGVSNGHQIPSISPTSTSPVNRESSLSQMNIKPTEVVEKAKEGEEADTKDTSMEPEPSASEVDTVSVETSTRRVQETRIETQEDVDTTI